MADKEYVIGLFRHLSHDSDRFFEKVADDVFWTVMGTHPLAGEYHTKQDFLDHTFGRLNKILTGAIALNLDSVLVDGDYAAVEMKARFTGKNGKVYENVYCWVVRFKGDMIAEVKAYVDSAIVQRLVDENE